VWCHLAMQHCTCRPQANVADVGCENMCAAFCRVWKYVKCENMCGV